MGKIFDVGLLAFIAIGGYLAYKALVKPDQPSAVCAGQEGLPGALCNLGAWITGDPLGTGTSNTPTDPWAFITTNPRCYPPNNWGTGPQWGSPSGNYTEQANGWWCR